MAIGSNPLPLGCSGSLCAADSGCVVWRDALLRVASLRRFPLCGPPGLFQAVPRVFVSGAVPQFCIGHVTRDLPLQCGEQRMCTRDVHLGAARHCLLRPRDSFLGSGGVPWSGVAFLNGLVGKLFADGLPVTAEPWRGRCPSVVKPTGRGTTCRGHGQPGATLYFTRRSKNVRRASDTHGNLKT